MNYFSMATKMPCRDQSQNPERHTTISINRSHIQGRQLSISGIQAGFPRVSDVGQLMADLIAVARVTLMIQFSSTWILSSQLAQTCCRHGDGREQKHKHKHANTFPSLCLVISSKSYQPKALIKKQGYILHLHMQSHTAKDRGLRKGEVWRPLMLPDCHTQARVLDHCHRVYQANIIHILGQ